MKCKFCQKEFELKNKNQQFCSRKCNATYHNKQLAKQFVVPKCKNCGKETKRISRAKFCSSKCQSTYYSGERATNWKGGKKKHSEGYVYILNKDHPNKDKEGYVLEHRLIMEKKIDRFLQKNEKVHHINGVKDDNRIENLVLLQSQADHLKEHNYFLDRRNKR